jgi:hypothetical protein
LGIRMYYSSWQSKEYLHHTHTNLIIL